MYSVNIAPAPSTVVAMASSTCGCRIAFSSRRTSGRGPGADAGSAKPNAVIATRPSAAVPAKDRRQPSCWPTQVASGTPPMLAMVRPINMVATAAACFSFGTRLAATTAPMPKKAPWLRLVTRRDSSSIP